MTVLDTTGDFWYKVYDFDSISMHGTTIMIDSYCNILRYSMTFNKSIILLEL